MVNNLYDTARNENLKAQNNWAKWVRQISKLWMRHVEKMEKTAKTTPQLGRQNKNHESAGYHRREGLFWIKETTAYLYGKIYKKKYSFIRHLLWKTWFYKKLFFILKQYCSLIVTSYFSLNTTSIFEEIPQLVFRNVLLWNPWTSFRGIPFMTVDYFFFKFGYQFT